MTMFLAPYTAIADIDGSPLDAGFLFFGEYGKDPESFPIETFWDAEFTIPAAQPIRTRNGYPFRNGSPAKVHLKQPNHSIAIKNRNGAFILVDFTNKGWDITFTEQQKQINDLQEKTNLSIINYVNPKMWGAKGDGIADDTQAIRDCFNFMVTNNATLNDFSENKYKFDSDIIIIAPNKKLIINGNCEFISDTKTIKFSGTKEQIGYLSSTAKKGDKTLTLNQNPVLNDGDLVAIHNSRSYSLSSARAYYQDGEYKVVESVVGNRVTLKSILETGYPAGVQDKVWKINPILLDIRGVKFISGGVSAAVASLAAYSYFYFETLNPSAESTARNSFYIDRCYSSHVGGGRYIKSKLSGSGTDYGILIGNSQDIYIEADYAYGVRHGIAVGGDNGDMAVPNRRIYIEKAKIENDPSTFLQAADFHGNTIDSHYKGCDIQGRISLSGFNVKSIGNKIHAQPGDVRTPIGLGEVIGGTVGSFGDEVVSSGSASYVMGWLTSLAIENINRDASFVVEDIKFAGNPNLLGITSFSNAPVKNNLIIDGFELVGDAPQFNRLANYLAGSSNTKPSYIQITRPKFAVPESVSIITGGAALTEAIKNVFSSSGSNENGSWIKNPDGSMTCNHRIKSTVAVNVAHAGGFKSPDLLWTFPQPFVGSTPKVIPANQDNSCICSKATKETLIQSNVFGIALAPIESTDVIIDVVAFGRYLP